MIPESMSPKRAYFFIFMGIEANDELKQKLQQILKRIGSTIDIITMQMHI